MHEYSIIQSLIESCEQHLKANDASQVTKLFVKIGVLSGVEPHLLQEAFEMFKEETVCHRAEFVMTIQPIKVACQSCLTESELDQYIFLCPHCRSDDLSVLDGEEMYLMRLEME